MTTPGRRDEYATTEVIRPAAVLLEREAREILAGLSADDVRRDGCWLTSPGVWQRYDRAWPDGSREPGPAIHLGTIRSIYDSPQRYFVTIFRASITAAGLEAGWTVETLCDDALKHAGLTLLDCPRAALTPLPLPFRQVPPPPRRPDGSLAFHREPDAEADEDRARAAIEGLAKPRSRQPRDDLVRKAEKDQEVQRRLDTE